MSYKNLFQWIGCLVLITPIAATCGPATGTNQQAQVQAADAKAIATAPTCQAAALKAIADGERIADKTLQSPPPKHKRNKALENCSVPMFDEPSADASPMPTTLIDLIVSALNSNLELQSKRLDPAFDKLRISEAWGAFDPNFNFNSLKTHDEHPQNAVEFLSTGQLSYTYHEDIIHYEAGFTGILPTGTQWELDTVAERADNTFNEESSSIFHPEYTSITKLNITQALLKNFGSNATLADVHLSEHSYAKSTQDYRQEVIKTIADVMGTYFEMVFGQENLKVKQEAVALAAHLVDENQHRLDQGRMAPIDVTDARERLSEAQEDVALAENFLAHRRDTLRELTRASFVTAPSDDSWNVDGSDLTREVPAFSRGLLLLQMFENNPSYLANMELVKEADVRLAYAKNQTYPSVDFKGSLDWNGLSNGWTQGYTNYHQRPGADYTAGVVVVIPLSGRADRARLSEARIRKTQALLNVKRSENELLGAFDAAMRDIGTATDRIRLVHESVVLAQQALASEGRRLDSGLTTSYNVSLSQKDLSQARSRELATYVDLNKALVQLYALVGTLPEKEHVEVKLN